MGLTKYEVFSTNINNNIVLSFNNENEALECAKELLDKNGKDKIIVVKTEQNIIFRGEVTE